jgi:ribose transport system ATP-binding protein
MGSGRSELIRTIFGLQKATNGSVQIAGHEALKAVYLTPPKALANGMNLLSEDRKAEGLALNLSILKNLTLSHLLPFTKWGTINWRKMALGTQYQVR